MQCHPLAELFPAINGPDFDRLVSSIKTKGLLNPIVTLDGKILDGRNRFRACTACDVVPRTVEYSGPKDDKTLLSWVIAQNINRMSTNQRAMMAARLSPGGATQ